MEIMQAVKQMILDSLKDFDIENLSNYERYIQMAQENYEVYQGYMQQYNLLTNDNAEWNLLLHTPEETHQYIYLSRRREDYAIETILFESFAAEAYINYYGEKKLGTVAFYKEYENNKKDGRKRSTLVKYREIAGLYENDDLYKKLKILIDSRNDLAHSHVRKFDINDPDLNNALLTIGNFGIKGDKSIYQIVEYTIGTTKELINFVKQNENAAT